MTLPNLNTISPPDPVNPYLKAIPQKHKPNPKMGMPYSANLFQTKSDKFYYMLIGAGIMAVVFILLGLGAFLITNSGFKIKIGRTDNTIEASPNASYPTAVIAYTTSPAVNPTFAPTKSGSGVTPTIKFTLVTMPTFKMTMQLPTGWTYTTGTSKARTTGEISEYYFFKNGVRQFSFEIGQTSEFINYCKATGEQVVPINATIGGKQEQIQQCFKNGVFIRTYSGIDTQRATFVSSVSLNAEMIGLLYSVQYTGDSHDNVR